MTGSAAPGIATSRRALLGLAFLSLGSGIGAALLAVPNSTPVSRTSTTAMSVGGVPGWVVGLGVEIVLPVILVVCVAFFYVRAKSRDQPFAAGLALVGFSAIAVGAVFVLLFQIIHYPGYLWTQGVPGPPPGNQTVTPPPSGPPGPGGNASGFPSVPSPPNFWATLAAWLPVIGGIAVALVVAFFALPRLAAREEPVEEEPATAPARQALEEAIAAMERDTSDPRSAIRAAYARLLLRARERLPPLEPATPREIEELLVGRLRVRRPVAQELTALFEEARYSSHPMGPSSVDRARELLGQALEELGAGKGGVAP